MNGDDVFGCDLVEVQKLTASWSSLIMMMIACDAGRVLDNCILLFQWWQMRGSPQITPTLDYTLLKVDLIAHTPTTFNAAGDALQLLLSVSTKTKLFYTEASIN